MTPWRPQVTLSELTFSVSSMHINAIRLNDSHSMEEFKNWYGIREYFHKIF